MAKALEQNTLSKQSLVAPTSKQVASKGYINGTLNKQPKN
jgi:hypothetical protein